MMFIHVCQQMSQYNLMGVVLAVGNAGRLVFYSLLTDLFKVAWPMVMIDQYLFIRFDHLGWGPERTAETIW
ncbi:hypothetical protein DJ028_23310 [Pseudomonas veronii]|nr:hypothetical protein DJ028_23310 [Pseudomonas veronii]